MMWTQLHAVSIQTIHVSLYSNQMLFIRCAVCKVGAVGMVDMLDLVDVADVVDVADTV